MQVLGMQRSLRLSYSSSQRASFTSPEVCRTGAGRMRGTSDPSAPPCTISSQRLANTTSRASFYGSLEGRPSCRVGGKRTLPLECPLREGLDEQAEEKKPRRVRLLPRDGHDRRPCPTKRHVRNQHGERTGHFELGSPSEGRDAGRKSARSGLKICYTVNAWRKSRRTISYFSRRKVMKFAPSTTGWRSSRFTTTITIPRS